MLAYASGSSVVFLPLPPCGAGEGVLWLETTARRPAIRRTASPAAQGGRGPMRTSAEEPLPVTPDDAFLRDIIADPDDDGLRLIYADWLDDHGDPERAEFIRVQCRLAQIEDLDAERLELEDRAEELLAKNQGR